MINANIKLLVLDVDGTLTDGGIIYDSAGNELKRFDVKDGLGIRVALAAGMQIAVLTGRKSPMLERRVKELGIQHLISGAQVKYPFLQQLLQELQLTAEEAAYIGDDMNDLQCMRHVGVSMCPQDAADEIKAVCTYVSGQNGGHGAVRDCIRQLFSDARWAELCSIYTA